MKPTKYLCIFPLNNNHVRACVELVQLPRDEFFLGRCRDNKSCIIKYIDGDEWPKQSKINEIVRLALKEQKNLTR